MKQGCNANGEVMSSVYVEHDPVDQEHVDDGMTRQEFAAECDINTLMSRYERTGILPLQSGEGEYLDLTEMPSDLQGILGMMSAAQASFMQLPAIVRKEFDNDPVRFVEYCADKSNLPRLAEWGLAKPVEPADAITAAPVPPEAPAAPKAP